MRLEAVRRHAARVLIGALAPLLLFGCATLAGLDKAPRVTLVTLAPVEVQILEQRYLATVRIQNPNPVALPITGLDYTISINGADFASGVSAQRVTVPAYGEKTLELGVSSTIVTLFEQLRRFGSADGRVRYAISGSLGLDGRAAAVPFEQDGEIDLRLDRPLPERAA